MIRLQRLKIIFRNFLLATKANVRFRDIAVKRLASAMGAKADIELSYIFDVAITSELPLSIDVIAISDSNIAQPLASNQTDHLFGDQFYIRKVSVCSGKDHGTLESC